MEVRATLFGMRWSLLVVACVLPSCGCPNDSVGVATDAATGTDTEDPSTSLAPTTTGEPETSESSSEGETGIPADCTADTDCDDDNACTIDACDAGECAPPQAVPSNACRPQIEVDFPPRAATLVDASPVVTVTGRVTSAAGPIAWLEIGGEEVEVAPDGSFSHDITALTGGNTLVLEAEDVFEVGRRRVQSFLWSTSYLLPTEPDEGIVDQGLGLYLDQETLDDGDRTPPIDDVASLLAVAVETIDISQFVPATPIYSGGGYNVYVTDVDYTSTDVQLTSIEGALHLVASLEGIQGDLLFDCVNAACFNLDQTGGFTATRISADTDLDVYANASHQLVADPVNPQTAIVDFDVTVDNAVVNFLVSLIEPFILNGIVADIEAELTTTIDTLLGPALTEAFTGLAPNSTLNFPDIADAASPIEVALVTDFRSTDWDDGGGVIVLRAGGYPAVIEAPYRNLGIPERADCGDGPSEVSLPRDGALEIGLTDDMLNELLNGAWRGGLLEFDMPDELLGPDSRLISDLQIHISGMLAPTASDCAQDGVVRAHLGDVRIDGSLLLNGNPVDFVAYSSLVASLEFSVIPNGIAITIGDVEQIETELTVMQDGQLDAEKVLRPALESQLVDGLIGAISEGGLGEIVLPEIDLSATLGLPAGSAVIQIQTESADRDPGTTVITGRL